MTVVRVGSVSITSRVAFCGSEIETGGPWWTASGPHISGAR